MSQSSRSGSARVKASGGWARHFDGWQPAALAVLIAGGAALLAVPRPVEPVDVPLPLADGRALTRVVEADAARAAALEAPRQDQRPARELDVDVRELGSAIRAFGQVDAKPERPEAELAAARRRILAAVPPALTRGVDEVLHLRAFQQRAFIRAARRWEATGEVTEDLLALGGDFPELARRSGWAAPDSRRLAMDDVVLAVLFKKRWNRVANLQSAPFAPTLDEERVFYRFLITHPLPEALPGGLRPAAARVAIERSADEYRLKKVTELAAIDPDYPRELARGVLLYRLGKTEAAVEAFRRHLDAKPDGAHALRANNYLRAALERASAGL